MTQINGTNNDGNVSKGYTKIKTYDTKTKETKTFLVPVGKKISYGGNTYDPSKGKNNELVIMGSNQKDKNLWKINVALEAMDVNKDGKIDKKDTDSNLAPEVNSKLGNSKYEVKDVHNVFSDAGIIKGDGGVVFTDKNQNGYEVRIHDPE